MVASTAYVSSAKQNGSIKEVRKGFVVLSKLRYKTSGSANATELFPE